MLSWKQVFLFGILKIYCDVTLKIHTVEYVYHLLNLLNIMQFQKG